MKHLLDGFQCPRIPTAYTTAFRNRAKGKWVVDTGANRHACYDRSLFESMEALQRLPEVMTARGVVLALSVRTVKLRLPSRSDLVLTDVLYILDFFVNLFSGVILYTLGSTIYGKTSTLRNRLNKVIDEINISVKGIFLKISSSCLTALYVGKDELRAKERLLHQRLCHLGHDNVRRTISMTKGVKLDFDKLLLKRLYYTCEVAKLVQKASRKPQQRALYAFDVIYTNVVGPINLIGKNRHR